MPSPNVSPIYNLTLFSLVTPSHYVVDLEVFTYFCMFYVHADFSELKLFEILKVYTKYTAVPLSYVYPEEYCLILTLLSKLSYSYPDE